MQNTKQKAEAFARQKWPDLDLSKSTNRMFKAFSLEEVIAFAEEFAEQQPYSLEQVRELLKYCQDFSERSDKRQDTAKTDYVRVFHNGSSDALGYVIQEMMRIFKLPESQEGESDDTN